MAASYSDQQFLSAETAFQNRVRQSALTQSIAVKTEAVTTAFHREREAFAVAVINAPDSFKAIFAQAVATNAAVISDATAAGTVVLSGANVVVQAALVTDAHIDTAITSIVYNGFFRTPAN